MGDSTDRLLSGTDHASGGLDRASGLRGGLALFLLVVFLILLQRCLCRMRSVAYTGPNESDSEENPAIVYTKGLNQESLDALPIFEYKSQSSNQGLECAVCLSEFQENEKCRILSNCNHSFHTECIDMWFYSHSTCPLCRAVVQPCSSSKVNTEEQSSISSSNIGGTNGSVYAHLMRGQTSSTAVHYQNPPDIVLWVREIELDQGVPTGRP